MKGKLIYLLSFIYEKNKTRNEIKALVEKRSPIWFPDAINVFDRNVDSIMADKNIEINSFREIDAILDNICEYCMMDF